MSIDVSQFHQVFFEESFEGLDVMESGLLDIGDTDDNEIINAIFRAAHSIKGGAGTFGFNDVSEFTHSIETLLDEVRNGDRHLSGDLTNLLLEAVDVLREMLISVQSKGELDNDRIDQVSQRLQQALADGNQAETLSSPQTVPTQEQKITGWNIEFKPHSHMLQMGNDPVRMFRELESLGDLSVTVDTKALPGFADLEPEDVYLSWHLLLHGDVSKPEIDEVFDWVEGDCDLTISPVYAEPDSAHSQFESEPEDVSNAPKDIAENQSATAQPAPARKAAAPAANASAAASIRVGTDKVDSLINLVGELVITQSMLSQIGDTFDETKIPLLMDGLAQLERNTREMQESIMRIRMLPISFAFNRFPRLVHDLTSKMNKQVELKLSGEQTELDKTVMEKIGDPLTHLVRNSLDHGLETPEVRRAAGKDEIGTLHLNAYHQGGNIVIEISDDGAGLNEEKILAKAVERGLVDASESLTPEKVHELIFMPGFSTADSVSDISGRGVGMDVVRKNINSLGGSVEVISEQGVGSKFTIRLPLTLAIMDGQAIRVGDEKYIIPLVSIIESLEIGESDVKQLAGKGELYQLRDEYLPVIRVADIFNLPHKTKSLEEGLLVIVEGDGQKVGLFIDELLGQQQVVIKSLETNYRKVLGLSGATIMGDGSVALIIDVAGLMALHRNPELAHKIDSERAA